jgi:CubicO group peptidase (beta-lactamase class C family)
MADIITSKAIDSFLDAEMQRRRIPGAAVAISSKGAPVFLGSYGLANVELQVPVSTQTMFQAGSIGKQFVAAAFLQFVEKSRLGLDQSIDIFFPLGPASWRNITVRHLLTHTSGLPNYDEVDGFSLRKDYIDEELVRLIASLPPRFEPGANWSYSNSGYVLLGLIIEKVTGTHFADYLKAHVWRPAQMSTVQTMSDEAIVPNRAAGYALIGGEIRNHIRASESLNRTADGTQYWTVHDAVKWAAALKNERVFSSAAKRIMWTPAKFNGGATTNHELGGATYGVGWFADDEAGRRVYYHTGSWAGFVAYHAYYPQEEVSLTVCANLADVPIINVARGVSRRLFGSIDQKPIDGADGELTRKVVQILGDGNAVGIPPEACNPSFPRDRLVGLNRALTRRINPLGALVGLEPLEQLDAGSVRRLRYRLRYRDASLRLEIGFDTNGKFSGPLRVETE